MSVNKRSDNVVVLFAKKPELGLVKTRIAEETSSEFALEFTESCIQDLLHKISKSDYYDLIVAVDNLDDLQWFQKNYSLEGFEIGINSGKNKRIIQSKKFDLIFSCLLNDYKYKKAILIPMDVPFIEEEDLITTFARLDKKKYVLGPEVNGGVYLIGIKAPFSNGIFKSVQWSTSYCYENILANFTKESCFTLKLKNDLNKPEDILKLRDLIYHNCPFLFKFLNANNYYFSVKDKFVNYDELSICIPVVTNIVQKINKNGSMDILIQTRHRPTSDPNNTGKIEIPSSILKKYELAHDAVVRTTKERTGAKTDILAEFKDVTKLSQENGNIIAIYRPFHCQQQLVGDRSYLCLSFISNYNSGKLRENIIENRNPHWIPITDLKNILVNTPEQIFSLSYAALKAYFSYYVDTKMFITK